MLIKQNRLIKQNKLIEQNRLIRINRLARLAQNFSLAWVGCIILALSFTTKLYAQDFAEARKNINQSLSNSGTESSSVKIAIIFETEQQETLRERINLVAFKRSLAQSFLQDYQVADPVLTSTTLEKQNLNSTTIKSNQAELQTASKLLGNNHFLFVRLRPLGEDLAVRYHLMDQETDTVHEAEYFYPLASLPQAIKTENLNEEIEAVEEYSENSEYSEYSPLGEVYAGEDLSWGYFVPAAPLSPHPFSADFGIAVTNTTDLEGSVGHLRLDFQTSILQFGTQTYGNRRGAHHSSYAYGKLNVFNPDSTGLPMSLSLGLKGRLFWSEHNKDFTLVADPTIAKRNKDRDSFTMLLAFQYHLQSIGLVTDLYADNLKGVFGVRWLLPANTRIFSELLWRNFRSDHHAFRDIAYGIEHAPIPNIKLYLAYQDERQQGILGGKFSW